MDFEKLFGITVILNYLKERTYAPYLGELLFPERKIEDIELEYIKGAHNLPVSASVHDFDTETEMASRDAVDVVKQSLALVKRKIPMSEKLLIKLNTPRTTKEQEEAIKKIYDDVDKMVLAVRTRIEAMRMECITSGELSFNENGYVGKVSYGMESHQFETLAGNSAWLSEEATPLQDITRWAELMLNKTGTKPTRALTSSVVLAAILRNASVRRELYGANSSKLASKEDLNKVLESLDLPKIATYDARYRVQGKDGSYETKRFLNENKFVLMPEGPLGETVYGLTAEEIELQGKAGTEISEVGNIIAEIYRTKDPVARWTKAVATALPTFPAAGEIFVATVK